MAEGQPSYHSSTLSQLAVASVGCYLVIAMWLSVKTGDISMLKWAAEVFGASYLTARGMNGRKPNGSEPLKP